MERRGSNSLKPVVSLEASLDEENREVLAALDGQRTQSPAKRDASTGGVRSMLDVDTPTPRHGSIAGIGVGVTSPNQYRKKRLDPADPTTWTSPHASPVEMRPRAASETDNPGLPIIQIDSRDDFEKNYNFDIPSIPSSAGQAKPIPRKREGSGSMAAALSGDLDALPIIETSSAQAEPTSPPAKEARPTSPSEKHLSPKKASSKYVTSGGTVVDSDAHRRLSNQSGSFSTFTDDSEEPVSKFSRDREGDEEAVEDSSDERHSSSDETSPVAERGRARKKPDIVKTSDEKETREATQDDEGETKSPKEKRPSHSQQVRSLLDPVDIGSRTTSGKFSETKSGVHPTSNYNRTASPAALAAFGADDADIQKAKTLALRISPVDDKVVDRHVKMIIRGDWKDFQDHEADDALFRHEPRLYLACSDLSNESSYALEWTIGTLLKDGDTILVISAIGDETASKQKDLDEPTPEIKIESARAAEEANKAMEMLTRQTTNQAESVHPPHVAKLNLPHSSASHSHSHSHSRSRDGRKPTQKEQERIKAVEKLEGEFLKYVRKTSLQVRCMIEVIHCRSPRHLIVNAIDELEPTLVVVGTRGQGTVRNVMMGSFSNYLVTKSSVPVMVARKRLKKARHAKVSSQQIRMTNNLTPFGITGKRKSLTQARID